MSTTRRRPKPNRFRITIILLDDCLPEPFKDEDIREMFSNLNLQAGLEIANVSVEKAPE